MKNVTKLPIALLALALAFAPLLAQPASAQLGTPILICPLFGGICEAAPQLGGFTYAFRASGNAYITAATPATSPIAPIACLQLLPYSGVVTVTITAPDGQQATVSTDVCPGTDGDGRFSPF